MCAYKKKCLESFSIHYIHEIHANETHEITTHNEKSKESKKDRKLYKSLHRSQIHPKIL